MQMSQLIGFPQVRVLKHSRVKKNDGGFSGGNRGFPQKFSWCFFQEFQELLSARVYNH